MTSHWRRVATLLHSKPETTSRPVPDRQVDALYKIAIKDTNLTADSRRELIEDLNQDGFDNLKNLSERDQQLVQNRLALIDQSRNAADPKIISDAFNEAEKYLKAMLARSALKPVP